MAILPWILLLLAGAADAVDGNDFSNNLFTDLAPLIALFGEQVSKQFLSQSLGLVECVMFAMAPLGIITGVVSAIRLSGHTSLKAIVGRTSETRSAAGLELTSSTSSDICELWDGKSVVRIMGTPQILSVVYALEDFEPLSDDYGGFEDDWLLGQNDDDDGADPKANRVSKGSVLSFEEAKGAGWFAGSSQSSAKKAEPKQVRADWYQDVDTRPPQNENPPPPPKRLPPVPPNLSFNILPRPSRLLVRIATSAAVFLQSLVIVLAALFTFSFEKTRDPDWKYAFPLFVTGTVLTCVGITICSYRVCSSSKQERWKPLRGAVRQNKAVQLLWIQRRQTVNDQLFMACAMEPAQDEILVSYTEEEAHHPHNITVPLGVGLAFAGFVTQFVGFRYLQWTISVAQLVAMIGTTLIRVFVQLPFAKPSRIIELNRDTELEWIIVKIHGSTSWAPYPEPPSSASQAIVDGLSRSQLILRNRTRLATMTKEISWDLRYAEDALLFKRSAEAFLNALWSYSDRLSPAATTARVLHWPVFMRIDETSHDELSLVAFRERHAGGWGKWTVSAEDIESFISLWVCHEPHISKSMSSETDGDPTMTPQDYLWAVDELDPVSVNDFDLWIRRSNHAFAVEPAPHSKLWFEGDDTWCLRSPVSLRNFGHQNADRTRPLLVMVTNSTMARMCGRYMLAVLVRRALQHLTHVGPETSVRPAQDFTADFTFLKNELIEQLAEALSQHDIMNKQDALAIIVPALRERDLLPRPPTPADAGECETASHARMRMVVSYSSCRRNLEAQDSLNERQQGLPEYQVKVYDLFRSDPDLLQIAPASTSAHNSLDEVIDKLKDAQGPWKTHIMVYRGSAVSFGSMLEHVVGQGSLGATTLLLAAANHDARTKKLRKHVPYVMHLAIKKGDLPMLRLLLYWSYRPIQLPPTDCNPLHVAVASGQLDCLKSLVEAGVDLETRDGQDCTVLQYAASNLDFVKCLVEAGAKLEAPVPIGGKSALAEAVFRDNHDVVKYLLEHGAHADPPFRWYGKPLSLASRSQNPAIIQTLVAHGAVVDYVPQRDPGFLTSPHWGRAYHAARRSSNLFAWSTLQMAAAAGNEVNVEYLLALENPREAAQVLMGRTALQAAAENGHEAVVARLLDVVDADEARADVGGMTALEAAAENGHLAIVKRLLDAGAVPDPPEKMADGGTALQRASQRGCVRIVKLLLENGADPNAAPADIGGMTALQAAAEAGSQEIGDLLRLHGAQR